MSKDLPTGWTLTRLGQLAARIQYGLTASAKASQDGPRFLRITDIQDGRVDWASVPSCDSSGNDLSGYELLPGDIVFARTGATTGKSYLIRQCPLGAVFASYLIRVRPQGSIRSDFLGLFFQSPAYWRQIAGSLAGNAQPNCNATKLASLEVPVPPLEEQKRIVERVEALLAEVSAALERLTRVREILKRFRQSVLAAACSGRLTEEWRGIVRPLKSATVVVDTIRRVCASGGEEAAVPAGDSDDLPDSPLPGTWTWCRVGDIARVCLGGTPSRKIASYWGGDVPWVSSSEVANCRISSTRETITAAGRNNSNARVYPPGTVLIAMIGEGKTRGQAAILDIAACTNQNSAGLVLEPATMSAEYVWYWALGEYEKNRSVGRGGNYPALNSAKVRALPIPVPPLGEQREIVRRVSALFNVADAIDTCVAAAMARAVPLPQAILAKAFCGHILRRQQPG